MGKWSRIMYHPNLPLGEDGNKVTASAEHIAISKNAAKEGMVLLKNEKSILPLARGQKVALFGKATIDYVKGGGGSGDVTVPYVTNLAEGFKKLGARVSLFEDSIDFYEDYVKGLYKEGKMPGLIAEPTLPEDILTKAKAFTDTAIISISRYSGEGWDRKSDKVIDRTFKGVDQPLIDMTNGIFERGDFYLSKAEEELVNSVSKAFEKTVIVLNIGGMFDVSWIKDSKDIDAALIAWQGGMEGGLATAELLCGLGNPSGKLADTFARNLSDYPGTEHFHDSDDYVEYEEDIYVGYRYFETIKDASDKVIYPFGYGLSYTDFSVSRVKIREDDGIITVKANVTNNGQYAGKEVVQIYVSSPQGKLGKPEKTLVGFKKTALLEPGQTQRVVVEFPVDVFASYDDLGKIQKSAYVLEKGRYKFFVGTDVRNARSAEQEYVLDDNKIVCQLTQKMAPVALKKRLLADGTYEMLEQGDASKYNENELTPLSEDELEGMSPAIRPEKSVNRYKPADKRQLIDVFTGKISIDKFIEGLSDEDLAWLVGGQPNTGVANTFGYGNNNEFGIPNVMTADGPAGLRIQPHVGVKTTAFPCATLLACTWDPEVATKVGIAGGEEVKENNIGVWLTPAMNIHRSPLCGRNFEYYSEDPLLTGKMAAGMVRGIQSNHIAATIKHFALNNKETNRKDSDSRASERAIREIYLKGFEIVVKEAHPWSIMTSYNIINGRRASENEDMINGILRGEWGFDGMVTTDWWTHGENYKECKAGNDMKMGCGYPDRIIAALEKGAITRDELNKAAKNILTLILRID
ncbi:glycoside hydrolase family 3 C-terminal domain-containing protein [Butyrivibrio sp. INlla16]|uniref:glycoside hydrolase family 3 protein n=1 Tax=Butyrivibrio sp. INlla16 TaxID=1520807 RepID=UPI00088C736B|nr:glycoside hydrolase family 3 protein [Butyrivibrio sp. INlla16]SDB42311.1 beta-glucosidase [Butyrivibrio sp. INlla16]